MQQFLPTAWQNQELLATTNSIHNDSSGETSTITADLLDDPLTSTTNEGTSSTSSSLLDPLRPCAGANATTASNTTSTNENENEVVIQKTMTFRNLFAWLNATRLPNANESLMTENIVHNLIVNTVVPLDTDDGSMDVLKQTMCSEDSPFLTWEADHDALKNANKRIPTTINILKKSKPWPIALHCWPSVSISLVLLEMKQWRDIL